MESLPKGHLELSSQLRRAISSVTFNISEGAGKQGAKHAGNGNDNGNGVIENVLAPIVPNLLCGVYFFSHSETYRQSNSLEATWVER